MRDRESAEIVQGVEWRTALRIFVRHPKKILATVLAQADLGPFRDKATGNLERLYLLTYPRSGWITALTQVPRLAFRRRLK
jgi:hypothetical protein